MNKLSTRILISQKRNVILIFNHKYDAIIDLCDPKTYTEFITPESNLLFCSAIFRKPSNRGNKKRVNYKIYQVYSSLRQKNCYACNLPHNLLVPITYYNFVVTPDFSHLKLICINCLKTFPIKNLNTFCISYKNRGESRHIY